MNILKRISEAQDRILVALTTCENRVGDLYTEYERLQPNLAELWNKLTKEERKHAELLEGVRDDLKEGELLRELNEFNLESVQHLVDYVNDRIAEARRTPPTEADAVAIALSIESSIIDARFFSFVHSNGSAFQNAASQLAHDTENHVKMIQDAKMALLKARR